MAGQTGAPTNGHARRTQETRQRIIAAVLELLAEGNINPTAEEVALRAHVGRRTVFRHFMDMETLHEDIIVEISKRFTMLGGSFESGDWEGRLQEIMDGRLQRFEKFLPFKRAADAYRHTSPRLQAGYGMRLASMRSTLEGVLPPAIQALRPLFEAIDLTLSYEAWQRLRIEQGLCEADAREVIVTLLSHLISAHRNAGRG